MVARSSQRPHHRNGSRRYPGTESSASNISAPPGITRPPQLLGPNDVGVSEVQRQLRLCLPAPGRAGRSALFGDPYL
jgi:hypothetical protein